VNKQAIFETVKNHLLSMDKRSYVEDNTGFPVCVYLDPDGRKCAIGALIPDGHPAQQVRMSVTTLLEQYSDLEQLWQVETEEDKNFLCTLQRVHDYKGHWDDKGLNAKGIQMLNDIVDEFNL